MEIFNRYLDTLPLSDSLADSLGFFGLQPVHKVNVREIKYRLDHPVLRELCKMVISITHQSNSTPPHAGAHKSEIPPMSFVIIDRKASTTVGGLLLSHCDQQERFFPLVIFNVMRKAQISNQVSILPLLLQEFMEQAGGLPTENWLNYDDEQLITFIKSLPKSLDGSSKQKLLDSEVDLLTSHTTDEFWQQLPGFEDERSQSMYLTALQAVLRMIADGRVAKHCVALKIPTPEGDSALTFLIYLLQLLDTCLCVQTNRWAIFWSQDSDNKNASLVIFFQPLTGDGLLQLLNKAPVDGSIIDLKSTIRSLNEPTRQASQLIQLPCMPLMEALFHWTRILCPFASP